MAETGEELGASDKTLRTMYMQSLLSSGIWWLVALVVASCVLLILFAKLRSLGIVGHSRGPPPPPPLPPPPPPRLLRAAAGAG